MEYDVASLIGTLGFPIAACVGLFYLYDKTIKDLTITLAKIDSTLEGIAKRLDAIEEYEKGE